MPQASGLKKHVLLQITHLVAKNKKKPPRRGGFFDRLSLLFCYTVYMSITIEDIQQLARLARIEVTQGEAGDLVKDFESILGYISELNTVEVEKTETAHLLCNVTREDTPSTASGLYTESILQNAPARKDNFIQVEQVL